MVPFKFIKVTPTFGIPLGVKFGKPFTPISIYRSMYRVFHSLSINFRIIFLKLEM
jgi:hypothetical protein